MSTKLNAEVSAVEHKIEQKIADVKYEGNKANMHNTNAPIVERAEAAVCAAGNAVSSNYHSVASDVKHQEAKRI